MKRRTVKKTNLLISMGIGIFISLMITIFATLIITILVTREHIQPEQIIYGTTALQLIAPFLGAFFVSTIVGERKLLICIGWGIIYCTLLSCISVLLYDISIENVWKQFLLVLGSSIAAGALRIRNKKTSYVIRAKRTRN